MKATSLILFFAFTALLIAFRMFSKIPSIGPEDVRDDMVGEFVVLRGKVRTIKQGEVSFLKMGNLTIVFFRNISINGEATILGRVEKYKGKLEVIGERVIRTR